MKIWRLEVDFQEYETYKIHFADDYLEELKDRISKLDSQGIGEINSRIKNVELIDGKEKGDFPQVWNLPFVPVISERGRIALKDIINDNCEFIQFSYQNDIYYLMNIITVIDAIDYEKSILKKRSSGLVVGFKKHMFKPNTIRNKNIFKIYLNNRIRNTEIFVSDDFKKAVEQAELKGFKFVEVWNNEE
ncbi:MAG: hypothetical protein JXN65_02160 [Clostridia bacterium]|nr:hypothetical protein [Clostridia bacterium]